MPWMAMVAEWPRRGFLGAVACLGTGLGAGLGAGLGTALCRPAGILAAGLAQGEYFLSSRGLGHQAQAVLFDLEHGVRMTEALPGRGHGLALRPGHREVALVGRRPGRFLALLNSADGTLLRCLTPPEGRWFNGHAAYSPEGSILFTSESGDEGDWIGRWAAEEQYRRLSDWPCHGVEPHEIALSPQGGWLVIANGGLRYGVEGAVLGEPGASSSLVWLNSRDGAVEQALTLPPDAADLSLRHFALLPDGAALVGLQAYGRHSGPRPLLALGHPRKGLKLLKLSPLPAMNYVGSVVAQGAYAALSCPRGNFIALLDLRQEQIVRCLTMADACGLAPLAHGFIATSGQGGALIGSERGEEDRLPASQLPGAWDNHLLAL